MAEEALDHLTCAKELRELDQLYAKKKREAREAMKQGHPDCWKLVEEQSALGRRMLEPEAREARKAAGRLREAVGVAQMA